jgi:hypothetical protein
MYNRAVDCEGLFHATIVFQRDVNDAATMPNLTQTVLNPGDRPVAPAG